MNTVSIKIRVINQMTQEVVIDNGDGITIQDYRFDVMEANANAFADTNPDCQVSMYASNGDFVCIPSRNMMKDEAEMEYDDYMAKWYPTADDLQDQALIARYEQDEWDEYDSICH